MSEHGSATLRELRRAAEGSGGGLLAVIGGRGPFYAGLSRPSAATLLEAVLTFLVTPSYEHIVVFSAAGDHLPEIDLGGQMTVDVMPGGWLFRGSVPGPASAAPAPARAVPRGTLDIDAMIREQSVANHGQLLFSAAALKWPERMEKMLDNIERRSGREWDGGILRRREEPAPRTLVVIDEPWLHPNVGHLQEMSDLQRRKIEKRFSALREISNSQLDLILLGTTRARIEGLATGEFVRAEEGDVRPGRFPRLELTGVSVLDMPRVDPVEPFGPWLPGASTAVSLYEALRSTPPKRAASGSDNPWRRMGETLQSAVTHLRTRVKGQDAAIHRLVSALQYAASGLGAPTGAGQSRPPRAVLFFAGPTGVGKTELAKALTELLFDDERLCLRTDMSEFQEKHTISSLIGAPTGYEGSGDGGQLTNRVRALPKGCGVVLFDEIDKAHPDILSLLLQVLDDGRLTDRSGVEASFSDTIVIFTSNLGFEQVDAADSPAANARRVREAIYQRIAIELRKPEFYGRIGDEGFVVFEPMRPDVALEIFDLNVEIALRNVSDARSITLSLEDGVRKELARACTADSARVGARDIRNKVKKMLGEPLARALSQVKEGTNAVITGWRQGPNEIYELDLRAVAE